MFKFLLGTILGGIAVSGAIDGVSVVSTKAISLSAPMDYRGVEVVCLRYNTDKDSFDASVRATAVDPNTGVKEQDTIGFSIASSDKNAQALLTTGLNQWKSAKGY